MGIGGIASANSMPVMQTTSANLKDHKSKSIQNEITGVQQQMQKLSSEEDLSANEKATERKKLQREISSLDTELKQHQEELLRSQKREIKMAQLREENEPAKEEKSEDNIQSEEASSDAAAQKNPPADRQQDAQPGTVITQNSDGAVILKEVLHQYKAPYEDTENKQADETQEENSDRKETGAVNDNFTVDANFSGREMHAMVSADSSMKVADHLGTLITRTDDGIAILKSEINLDESRGTNTERKQAELEEMEKQKQRETAFQSSFLSKADSAMKSAAETNASAMNILQQDDAEKNIQVSGLNVSPEEQDLQQGFQISVA